MRESKYDYYVSYVYGVPKAVFPNVYVAEIQELNGSLRDASSLVVQLENIKTLLRDWEDIFSFRDSS